MNSRRRRPGARSRPDRRPGRATAPGLRGERGGGRERRGRTDPRWCSAARDARARRSSCRRGMEEGCGRTDRRRSGEHAGGRRRRDHPHGRSNAPVSVADSARGATRGASSRLLDSRPPRPGNIHRRDDARAECRNIRRDRARRSPEPQGHASRRRRARDRAPRGARSLVRSPRAPASTSERAHEQEGSAAAFTALLRVTPKRRAKIVVHSVPDFEDGALAVLDALLDARSRTLVLLDAAARSRHV